MLSSRKGISFLNPSSQVWCINTATYILNANSKIIMLKIVIKKDKALFCKILW